jgi:hypothetical protein
MDVLRSSAWRGVGLRSVLDSGGAVGTGHWEERLQQRNND